MAFSRRSASLLVALAAALLLVGVGIRSRLTPDPGAPAPPRTGPVEGAEAADESPGDQPDGLSATPTAPRIVGVVLGTSDEPVPHAVVEDFGLREALSHEGKTPRGRTTRSDELGRFSFDEASEGGHALLARHPDFGVGLVPLLRVPKEGTVKVELRLDQTAELRGRVVSKDGSAIAGARITTDAGAPMRRLYRVIAGWWFRPSPQMATISDETGRFRLGPVLPGNYDLTADADGHARRVVQSVPAPGEILITLEHGGAVRGVVRFPDGEPPSEIRLTCRLDGLEETIPVVGAETPFAITGLAPGEYELTAAATGFSKERRTVTVGPARDSEPVVLSLLPGTTVSGLVLDSSSGKPVGGARVGFHWAELNVLGGSYQLENEVVTDPHGRYTVRLRPGSWSCSIRKQGYFTVNCTDDGTLFPVTSEPLERDLTTAPVPAAIIGFVHFPDGDPVAGAEVSVVGVGDNPDREDSGPIGFTGDMGAVTAADGSFRLEEGIVPWGDFDLLASGPGGATDRLEGVRFRPGQREVEVRFEIPRLEEVGGRVTGRVVDEAGRPVAGSLFVFARKAGAADADGRFERDGVPPGRHIATLGAVGFATAWSKPFDVAPRETVDLGDLVLRRDGVRVRGTISDVAGQPVEGARITVWFFPPGGRSIVLFTSSRADGGYDLIGPDLPGKEIAVQASGIGFVHTEKRVTPESEAIVDLTMSREGSITGTVTFSGELPAEISAFTNGHGRFSSLAVEWDRGTGTFTVLRAKPGPHRLQIRAEGFAPSPYREVVVPDGGSVGFGSVRLSAGGVLSGRVVDAAGAPIPDVQVSIKDQWLYTSTDEEGKFRLERVPPGSHVLLVNGLEGREESPEFPAEVKDGRETKLELRIPR